MEIAPDMEAMVYEAALRGCVTTLNTLIQRDKLLLNKISLTPFSETPLHISASLGHLEFTEVLLREKPKMAGEHDSLRRHPLHLAAAEGHADVVKALVHADSDVCLECDQDGRIPLHLAAIRGRVEVVKELINERPESTLIQLDGDSILHLCVRYNHLEVLKFLMEKVSDDEVTRRNEDGNTVLHLATILKQSQTIRYLLSMDGVKARINALNANGFTPLDMLEHCPMDFKNLEIRGLLMESGAIRVKEQKGPLLHPPPQPTVAISDEAKIEKSRSTKLMKYFKYQGNWVEEAHGSLMIVATVIATMTFQAAISPPGGVWQEDYRTNEKVHACSEENICHAGTAVGAYTYQGAYTVFIICNSVAFVASLVVILLISSGLPLKNKFFTSVLTVAMCVIVTFMTVNYFVSLDLVSPDTTSYQTEEISFVSFYVWCALIGVVGVFDVIRFMFWARETLKNLTGRRSKLQNLESNQQTSSREQNHPFVGHV